jgi:copper oxidase (laccase) domain-containing protein
LNALWHPDWLVPQWPAPAGVRTVFTTRVGGCSPAPYDSMNLGDHVGDAPAHVAANRQRLLQAIGSQPVFLQQVHGTGVIELDPLDVNSLTSATDQVGDACLTRQRDLACTIMVADCLPVLLAHLDVPVVAAAHAGWRGLAGPMQSLPDTPTSGAAVGHGVLESLFMRFAALVGGAPGDVAGRTIAWLGPCIGPSAFEVGAEVRAAFTGPDPAAAALFAPCASGTPSAPSKYLADLAGLARLRLDGLGVTQVFGNDGAAAWCTAGQASRFFSHRRDAGGGRSTGRMAACIWLA